MSWYNRGKLLFLDPTQSASESPFAFASDLIKVALMKSTYSFNADHNTFSDASATEIVATGYTARGDGDGAGGLGTKSGTENDTNDRAEWDAADHVYPSIGGTSDDTIAGIIVMRSPDAGETSANTELIANVGVGSTLTNGGNITLVWNSAGILHIT